MAIHIIKLIFLLIKLMDTAAIIEELFQINNAIDSNKTKLMWMQRTLSVCQAVSAQCCLCSTKTYWTQFRKQSFWEYDCQLNSDSFFKTNFRMKRSSFEKLCVLLKSLEKKNTNFRKAIPLKKRIAIALYALGSSAEYRTIGNMFGVGKSTVCTILIDFCKEAWICLQRLHLKNFPLTETKIKEYVHGVESLGFPQVLGAIDGCHIAIHPAKDEAVDYHNYKGWNSTVLLALVDARCRFIYINVGSPGRCNDSTIFEQSLLKKELLQCSLLNEMAKEISGVNVPIVLLGDSAFKLGEHLMKPYPFVVNQPPIQKTFNYNLSKCRRVVENAFGHLKARFRRIGKGIDNQMKNTTLVIRTCCALHNFLNEENDDINEHWLAAQQVVDNARDYPDRIHVNNNGKGGEKK